MGRIGIGWIALFFCQGCHPSKEESAPSDSFPETQIDRQFKKTGKIWGDLSLFPKSPSSAGTRWMWQGALQTLACFPLAKTEPGFIQTQWIGPYCAPLDRFQITVVLMPCARPCVEAIDVVVCHQRKKGSEWYVVPDSGRLAFEIKKRILLTVRQATVSQQKG